MNPAEGYGRFPPNFFMHSSTHPQSLNFQASNGQPEIQANGGEFPPVGLNQHFTHPYTENSHPFANMTISSGPGSRNAGGSTAFPSSSALPHSTGFAGNPGRLQAFQGQVPPMVENESRPSPSTVVTEPISPPAVQEPPSLFTKVYKCALCQARVDGFNAEADDLAFEMNTAHYSSDRSCFSRMMKFGQETGKSSIMIMEDGDPDPDFVVTYLRCTSNSCRNKDPFPKSEQQQHLAYHQLNTSGGIPRNTREGVAPAPTLLNSRLGSLSSAASGSSVSVPPFQAPSSSHYPVNYNGSSSDGVTKTPESRGTGLMTPLMSNSSVRREKKRSGSWKPVQPSLDISVKQEEPDIIDLTMDEEEVAHSSPIQPHREPTPASRPSAEKKTLMPTPTKEDSGIDLAAAAEPKTSTPETATATSPAVPEPDPPAAPVVKKVRKTYICQCGFSGGKRAFKEHYDLHHGDDQSDLKCFMCHHLADDYSEFAKHVTTHIMSVRRWEMQNSMNGA